MAKEGADVFVTDINDEQGLAVAQSIGAGAIYHHLDASDPESWDEAIDEVDRQLGGLDILVNNAGCGAGGGIEVEPLADHRRVLDLNVTGVWLGIRAAIKPMQRLGGGSIINISSIDGLVGVTGLGSYVASKFAVTGITRSLSIELGPAKIRVNAVHPGIIATPMVKSTPPWAYDRLRKAVDRQPLQRMGEPDEIAAAVAFFASDDSSFCTGASLVVDGGHIAGPFRDPVEA